MKWIATITNNILKDKELIVEATTIKNLVERINKESNLNISQTTIQNIYWGRANNWSKTVKITKGFSQ
tara:strand:- start:390 stop:593 length:204 start_codon:yes stop_codon:yes gene_type:complete